MIVDVLHIHSSNRVSTLPEYDDNRVELYVDPLYRSLRVRFFFFLAEAIYFSRHQSSPLASWAARWSRVFIPSPPRLCAGFGTPAPRRFSSQLACSPLLLPATEGKKTKTKCVFIFCRDSNL